jgi:hypothetical protein
MKHMTKKEALNSVRNALVFCFPNDLDRVDEIMKAINEAPAQSAQEPVAKVARNASGQISIQKPDGNAFDISKYVGQSFYTTQPKRPWVGLTDEEQEYWIGCNTTKQALARAINNALKEKNT